MSVLIGEGPCHNCGVETPVWFTSNDLWNTTVGNEGGILCPTCFMHMADDGKRIFKVSVTPDASATAQAVDNPPRHAAPDTSPEGRLPARNDQGIGHHYEAVRREDHDMTKVMFVARALQLALCVLAGYLYGWGGVVLVIVASLLAGLVMVEERLHDR